MTKTETIPSIPKKFAAVILDFASWTYSEGQWAKDRESADELIKWIGNTYPELKPKCEWLWEQFDQTNDE